MLNSEGLKIQLWIFCRGRTHVLTSCLQPFITRLHALLRGVPARGEGGVGIPACTEADPPLWTEFLTHTTENITLTQTSFAGGNYPILVSKNTHYNELYAWLFTVCAKIKEIGKIMHHAIWSQTKLVNDSIFIFFTWRWFKFLNFLAKKWL